MLDIFIFDQCRYVTLFRSRDKFYIGMRNHFVQHYTV